MSGKRNARWAARKSWMKKLANAAKAARSEHSCVISRPKGLMKPRAAARRARHGPEFKGVVKKIAGKLTNRPDLVSEGRAEMAGGGIRAGAKRGSPGKRKPRLKNPDPHRRG
jgi:hypothetical protein